MPAVRLRKERKRSWLARITGKDQQYGLAREFVPASSQDEDFGIYLIEEDALYQYQHPSGQRQFMTWRNGEFVGIADDEAFAWKIGKQRQLERSRINTKPTCGRVDDRLLRLAGSRHCLCEDRFSCLRRWDGCPSGG